MMKAIGVLVSLVLASGAQAQSLKEKSELSEQCGKKAAELFEKSWGKREDELNHYESHYNSRLNKCFYVEWTNSLKDGFPFFYSILYDLNENKEYGSYAMWMKFPEKPLCQVQMKSCESQDEWAELIKPFIKD
jgi:hypothetical protein